MTQRRSLRDLETTLAQIVASAVDTVPGVEAGSISMTEDGHIYTRHPTSKDIGKLDDLQSQPGEGPCISAILDPPESGLVVAADLAGADAERRPRCQRSWTDLVAVAGGGEPVGALPGRLHPGR